MAMKRWVMIVAAATMVFGVAAGPAAAHDHEGGTPEHPHALVLGLEFDESGEVVGFRKCVDLAGNRALPLHAHHDTVHTGTAGQALFEKAGHGVVPLHPLFPGIHNCADLIAAFEAGEL